MHVYLHYTVVQHGHEPPPTGFEPATSAGLGAPSTPQPPDPVALLRMGTAALHALFNLSSYSRPNFTRLSHLSRTSQNSQNSQNTTKPWYLLPTIGNNKRSRRTSTNMRGPQEPRQHNRL